LIVAVCGGTWFLIRGLSVRDNIIDLRLFADRNYAAASLTMAGFSVAMFGGIAILPLFVQGLLGYPVVEAGYLFIPRGLAAGFSMVLTGTVLVNRFDPRLLAAIGLVLTATSNFQTGALNLNADFWQLAWPGVIGGLGMGLVFVPMSTLAFDRIGPDRQDEASGLYGVTRQLGSSIGIAVVGALLVRSISSDTALLSEHVTAFNPAARAYLSPLAISPQSAGGAALLSAEITRQAAMMAYAHVFNVLGVVAAALLPLLLLMKRPTHATGAPMGH